MNSINITSLQKNYPNFLLTVDSLQVKEGFITGFIGENGSGKTTTLRAIMGLISTDAGTIEIFGKSMKDNERELKEQIGFLGEHTGYFELLKLSQIKKMVAPFYPNWNEGKYQELISHFTLNENTKWKDLSQGKKKLFSLAILLAKCPKLIIMDEPTANLDPLARQDVLDILAIEMEREGTTIFFSTHITSDLDKIADYVCFLHEGKLLLQEEKDKLLETHRVVKGPTSLLSLEKEACFIGIRKSDFGFVALSDDIQNIEELFGDEVIFETPTLEDIFIFYTKGVEK